MKITKNYLKIIIKEELQFIVEQMEDKEPFRLLHNRIDYNLIRKRQDLKTELEKIIQKHPSQINYAKQLLKLSKEQNGIFKVFQKLDYDLGFSHH